MFLLAVQRPFKRYNKILPFTVYQNIYTCFANNRLLFCVLQAYIVRVVKEKMGMRTLAIGDGANDVSMIQTADVGVGVLGREGTQAVMAADFAIGKFPMLARLLLLHGHWCYDRLARMILYFFYKNASFVFLIFWYQVRHLATLFDVLLIRYSLVK